MGYKGFICTDMQVSLSSSRRWASAEPVSNCLTVNDTCMLGVGHGTHVFGILRDENGADIVGMAHQLRYALPRPRIPHSDDTLRRARRDNRPIGVGGQCVDGCFGACSLWRVECHKGISLARRRRQVPEFDRPVEGTGREPLLLTATQRETTGGTSVMVLTSMRGNERSRYACLLL